MDLSNECENVYEDKWLFVVKYLACLVYKELGPGHSEKVYHDAFTVLLRNENLKYETEVTLPIHFLEQQIGFKRADLIVENEIVVEFKTVKTLNLAMEIQCRCYSRLKKNLRVFLVNFPLALNEDVVVKEI